MEGEIRAVRVMISGEFSGQIEADRLEIVASGKVSGELIAGQLMIESGAQFNGTSKVKSDQASPEPARGETVSVAKPKRSEKGSKTQNEKPLTAEAETG